MNELASAKQISLADATIVGLSHLTTSLAEFDPADRQYLDGFNDYLKAWIGVAAWSKVTGTFGHTNVTKIRVLLAQLRGHYGSISNLGGGVASALYSERKIAAADKWYQVYRRNGEVSSIRGPIALAKGDFGLAKDCFEEVLVAPGIDGDGTALHLGYLSVALAKLGRFTEAIRVADQATSLKETSASVLTRVWRTRAQTLGLVGDRFSATSAIEQAITIATGAGLIGQVSKSQTYRRHLLLTK